MTTRESSPTPPSPAVAVVVVSWNSRNELGACLRSLEPSTVPLEVVLVDNASDDGSAAYVREAFPAVRVREAGTNLGFGAACNLGWRATQAPLVLFLNPDAAVDRGAVEALCEVLARRPEVGIVGPATRSADGTPQVSFGPDLTLTSEWHQRRLVRAVKRRDPAALAQLSELCSRAHEPAWVSASCLLIRRSLLEQLGGFDEQFFLYEEDVDLCVRAGKQGVLVVFTPEARVAHALGRSMGGASLRSRIEYDRSHLAYYRKHHGRRGEQALRFILLVTALGGLLSSLGRASRRVARSAAIARLRLALRPSSPADGQGFQERA